MRLMTTNELKKLKDAKPFQPFTMHLADGGEVTVKHPDFLAYSGGRTAFVGYEDGDFDIVDLLLVSRLSVSETTDAA